MLRFYIPPHSWSLDRLELDADERHHAVDVLRIKEGDRATLFNGEGVEAEVEISKAGRHGVEFRRVSLHRTSALRCRITIGQAVPKGKNMDLIVEKATELGVAEIVPILSERTIVRGTEAEYERKQQKWQRVAIEACKQCGQNWLPDVRKPRNPRAFFESCGHFDLMLIASLQDDAQPIKEALSHFGACAPSRVLILIGPEGDFTPAELALAKSRGCIPVSLGPIILRTETAAICALSILNHELQS